MLELAVFGTLGVRDVCLFQSSQSDLAVWACSLQAIAKSDHGKMRLNGFMPYEGRKKTSVFWETWVVGVTCAGGWTARLGYCGGAGNLSRLP